MQVQILETVPKYCLKQLQHIRGKENKYDLLYLVNMVDFKVF